MNNPLVSVLIPCYNVSKYVKDAIDCILNQTYNNLEIWLIDDASTDDTRKILDSYQDERIKKAYFDQNTKKVGAVNDVLKKVNGTFICFQDSDDSSGLDRIQKQVEYLLKHPDYGICFTGYDYFGDIERLARNISISNEDLIHEFINFYQLKSPEKESTCCASMMISNLVLKKEPGYHPYFAGRVGEDIYWIYKILKSHKGHTLNEVLYHVRKREGSFTDIQFSGKNAKYAYSWNLLGKIIQKEVNDKIDILDPHNIELLKTIELQSCEDALLESINKLNEIINNYENSRSFKFGKFFLKPFNIIRNLKRKLDTK
jgi:glycosyltransferase involved in cell wall biosynthesis